jgi:hypothetical protein
MPVNSHPANAYLVLGPESSGTRLFTRILLNSGCAGSAEHQQPWDDFNFPEPTGPIVFRRSIPSEPWPNKQWPNIDEIVHRLRDKGYLVRAAVTTRDWQAVIRSQAHVPHVPDERHALQNLQRAYPHIFSALGNQHVPFVVVSYESLVYTPATLNYLLKLLDRPSFSPQQLEELNLYDGNTKWIN